MPEFWSNAEVEDVVEVTWGKEQLTARGKVHHCRLNFTLVPLFQEQSLQGEV